MRLSSWVGGFVVVLCVACGDDDGGGPHVDAGDEDAGLLVCRNDSDCSDGVFCNGIERCVPNRDEAAADGCVSGVAPRCNDGIACTVDACSHVANACRFTPIDADGDGHAPSSCVTTEGESLGDDCDDNDDNRFPGNPETCTSTTENHDEDCDPSTIGVRDADGDVAIDVTCCNGDRCGDDCDDLNPRRGSDYPEVCDEVDNDCDLRVDEDAISRPWYPDLDRDGFGDVEGASTHSCAPVPGHSLFGTDCDDTAGAINPAAMEICDGVDNNCGLDTDENDVCVCGVPGADPCECSAGMIDCLGGLIPRTCVSGHWVTTSACSGVTPICLMGRCVCADGGTSCINVIDRSPPFVLATAPAADVVHVPTVAVVAVVLSEPPAPSTINATTFRVLDDNHVDVEGARTVDGQLVVFTPNDGLLPGHIYNVVFEDVTDRAGNAMRASLSWRFATEVGDYPREVVNNTQDVGFASPVLRASATGDVALWVDTSYAGSDYITSGEEMYRRASNGTWSRTQWPALNPFAEVPPTSFAIGSGGLIAALGQRDLSFELLRHGATDTLWNVAAPTGYGEPAAITVVGDQVIAVAQTANNLFQYVEVATANGTDPLTPNPNVVRVGTATGLAVAALDANTIAVVMLSADEVTTACYSNGTWNVTTVPASMPSDPSVQLHTNGTAVASWLQLQEVMISPNGPTGLFPVHNVAFFDASTTTLTPISMVTLSPHAAPQVAWLNNTTVMASHTEARPIANLVSTNGSIVSRLDPQGRLGGTRMSSVDLAVLPNGNAVATWIHSGSMFGDNVLVAARYTDGVWQPVEAVSDSLSPALPQVEALPDNTALLVWNQAEPVNGVAIVLP